MDNTTKEKLKKVEKFALGAAEFFVDSMAQQAKSYSNINKFSEEYREQYAELSDGLSTLSEHIHDFKNRDKKIEEFEENEFYENFSYGLYDESTSENSNECPNIQPKKYDSCEKIKKQRELSASNIEIGGISLEDWDSLWLDYGKLTTLCIEDISNSKVGLIKLICNNKVVLIVRAINLKSGGIQNKLTEIIMKKHNNMRISKKIDENYNNINVEILEVGCDNKAINICRNLEMKMIKTYQPLWLT